MTKRPDTHFRAINFQMSSLVDLILEWPLARQIFERKDGTGLEAMSDKTRAMHARIDGAKWRDRFAPTAASVAAN